MIGITAKDKTLFEQGVLSLENIEKAYAEKDERLAEYIIKLAIIDPTHDKPKLEDSENDEEETGSDWDYGEMRRDYHVDARDWSVLQGVETQEMVFSARPHQILRAKKASLANERLALLTQNGALVPPRLQLDDIILRLWNDKSTFAQSQLLRIIKEIPLKWGPWRAIKKIFKQSFLLQEWAIYTPVVLRLYNTNRGVNTDNYYRHRNQVSSFLLPIDPETANWGNADLWDRRQHANDLTTETKIFIDKYIGYHLDEMEEAFESEFVQIVKELLIIDENNSNFSYELRTRVEELCGWEDPKILLQIFSEARNEQISLWALDILIEDFRKDLSTLPPSWIIKQATSPSASSKMKRFVFQWFVEPITTIEMNDFLKHGLQTAVLAFLDYTSSLESWSDQRWLETWHKNPNGASWTTLAREYACTYIRAAMHDLVDDLSLDKVLWLLRNRDNRLQELGKYLLFPEKGDSPYAKQLDLDFWTNMLGDSRLHDFSQKYMEQKYTGVDLSKEWYRARLQQGNHKIETMVVEWLKKPSMFREEDDFYDIYFDLLVGSATSSFLRDWTFQQLTAVDEKGASLLDRLTAQDYRNFLLSSVSVCRQIANDASKNGKISYETFPVGFLKHLINRNEFNKNGWKEFITEKTNRLSYSDGAVERLAKTMLINHPELPLHELGREWVLERVKLINNRDYNFVRELFQQKFAMTDFVSDDRIEGGKWLLKQIFEHYNPNAEIVQFWRQFIFSRIPLHREYTDASLPKLAEELQFPEELFSLQWFEEVSSNYQPEHRKFAMDIASLKMFHWVTENNIGFQYLKELLFSSKGKTQYQDVRDFILQSMDSPKYPEGKLDIFQETFTSEDLYDHFCFSSRDEERTWGMQIIEKYPFHFGQPDKILVLSNSSDPKIRETVIRVIWRQCEIRSETAGWKPYEKSVLPQSEGGRTTIRAIYSMPPKGKSVKDISSREKYIGLGSAEAGELNIQSFAQIEDFMQRTLFRLPKSRRSPKAPKIGFKGKQTWKNKRTLVKAVRDMAIQNKEFAKYVVPILQEFQLSKGRIIREACICALAEISEAHNLDIFGGEQ